MEPVLHTSGIQPQEQGLSKSLIWKCGFGILEIRQNSLSESLNFQMLQLRPHEEADLEESDICEVMCFAP